MQALRDQLARRAAFDGLTGCLNHRAFHEALAARVAQAAREGSEVSLLALDVDDFKAINDRHGHHVGDAVLRALGKLLRAECRRGDVVGRLGGDELAVLCPGLDAGSAAALAERLCRKAREELVAPRVTLSIGICTLRARVDAGETLRHRADRALYAAKRRGRNGYVLDGAAAAEAMPTPAAPG